MHEGGMESNWESTFSDDEFTHIPPGARAVPRDPPLLVYPTPWRFTKAITVTKCANVSRRGCYPGSPNSFSTDVRRSSFVEMRGSVFKVRAGVTVAQPAQRWSKRFAEFAEFYRKKAH